MGDKIMNGEKYKTARQMLCRYLAKVAKDKSITHEQIAEKTGFTRSNVSRMLSGKYPPILDNFIKLAEACEVYFFVIDKDADDELVNVMKKRWGSIYND